MSAPTVQARGVFVTTLATLLSHYRRHPGQLAMLLLGLWVASALWSGVQAINASARDSYARAEALFENQLDRIERQDGQPLTLDDYLTLRRAGAPVSPLVEGRLRLAGDTVVTLLGIDPLTLPGDSSLARQESSATALRDWLLPPHRLRAAPDVAAAARADSRLPPVENDPSLPPATLVSDIGVAQALLGLDRQLTRLVVAPSARLMLPENLVRIPARQLASPGQLADSFHLNLTAMGLLALVVGLFIVHAALGLALEQRLGLMRTLRALGVPARTLVGALITELLAIGLIGALAGIFSGVALARWLLPDVAASLDALYDSRVSSQLVLPWYYWLGGLAITLGGLATAGSGVLWRVARLEVLTLGQAQAWRARLVRQWRRQALAGSVLLGVAAGLGVWLSASGGATLAQGGRTTLIAGFTMVTAALLGVALWLPALLAMGLQLASRALRRRPLWQWAVADLQLQLPRLQLAMMALLLALAANLGVSSMVGGFRLTFLDWLDQRLLADIYVHPDEGDYARLHEWLEAQPEVATLLPARHAQATLVLNADAEADSAPRAVPVALFGIHPAPVLARQWPLQESVAGREAAWQALREGAVFVNEQLARRHGLHAGETLTLRGPDQRERRLAIAAVYPDYGNPHGEIVMPTARLAREFGAPPGSLGVGLAEGSARGAARDAALERLRTGLAGQLAIPGEVLTDQRRLKATSKEVFERTFAITRALNALTLGVAALALLTTLLAQAGARRAQLAPLWALGVPRTRLVTVQLGQLVGAALATALVALPLGIALAWALVAVINVAAFGWRLPLHIFPGEMAVTLALAVLVAAGAALLPARRLWRSPPRRLLEEFAAT
ncbi:ABC transporter permease [Halomonas sp. HP20-15]|uniref:ABC transporter permease n=1 Tax=Halomonas sp. HP20-15 TaxID=3085901 RepID=UPI00298205F9|nr:ABC transporter permease [Halomonas sp. HP20-15]MDW5378603.1 ABC transporter permease [Halomonas sp. HP20-15]